MKYYSIILLCFCVVFGTTAQNMIAPGILPKKQTYSDPAASSATTGGNNRVLQNTLVDYYKNEFDVGRENGTGTYYIDWELHDRKAVSCSPLDTIDNGTVKWAGVRFDSIFDVNTHVVYQKQSINTILVDTIYVELHRHQNISTLEDTIVFSILEVDVTSMDRGLTLNGSTVTNNVVWTDTLFTTTSLARNRKTKLAFPVNGVSIPSPKNGFIVMVNYWGHEYDRFVIADANNYACSRDSMPKVSSVPENSLSYLNYIVQDNGCIDLSGIDDVRVGTGNCSYYYRQNIGISASIRVDADLSASAAVKDTLTCPAQIDLRGYVGGGSGSYTFIWHGGPQGTVFSTPNAVNTMVSIPDSSSGLIPFYFYVLDQVSSNFIQDTVYVQVKGIGVDVDDHLATCTEIDIHSVVTQDTIGTIYQWSDGSTTTPTFTGATYDSTYSVTVTNAYGCTASDHVLIDNVSTQTLDIATASTTVCYGQSVSFSNNSSQPTGWDWNWDFGNNLDSSDLFEPTFTFGNSGLYTVGLRGDSADCSFYAEPLLITVLSAGGSGCNGNIETSMFATPFTVCAGGTTTIRVNATGGIGGYTYQWSPAAGLSNDNGYVTTATVEATTTYYVTVTDGNTSVTDSITIEVFYPFTADAGHDDVVCPGEATVLHGQGGVTYYWTPTTDLSCGNCQSPIIDPTSSTTITMYAIDENGCQSTDDVVISVSSSIEPVVTIEHDCSVGNNMFTAVPIGGGADVLFHWLVNGDETGVRLRSFDPSGLDPNDAVSCIMISSLSCVTIDTAVSNTLRVVDCTVGIADLPQSTIEVNVYPNPSKGLFFIAMEPVYSKVDIEVFNMQGQNVFTTNTHNAELQIDLSDLSEGLYLMRVSSDRGTAIQKLVKE